MDKEVKELAELIATDTTENKTSKEIAEHILQDYVKVTPIPDLEGELRARYCFYFCGYQSENSELCEAACVDRENFSKKLSTLVSQYLHQLAEKLTLISDDAIVMQRTQIKR